MWDYNDMTVYKALDVRKNMRNSTSAEFISCLFNVTIIESGHDMTKPSPSASVLNASAFIALSMSSWFFRLVLRSCRSLKFAVRHIICNCKYLFDLCVYVTHLVIFCLKYLADSSWIYNLLSLTDQLRTIDYIKKLYKFIMWQSQ